MVGGGTLLALAAMVALMRSSDPRAPSASASTTRAAQPPAQPALSVAVPSASAGQARDETPPSLPPPPGDTGLLLPTDTSAPGARERAVNALQAWEAAGQSAAAALAGGQDARTDDGETCTQLIAVRDGRVYRYKTCNANAAIGTAANLVRQTPPYNVDGTNLAAGVWDAGTVRSTHQEFGGRVILKNAVAAHYHSTHVGGTIGARGVDATAKGMAPAVRIWSYDWNSDLSEMASVAMSATGQVGVIQISNHSYGLETGWEGSEWFGTWATRSEADGFGMYDSYAAMWDAVCYGAPYYLPFLSAGNDRNDTPPAAGSTFSYYDGGQLKTKPYDPATDPPADGGDGGGYDTVSYMGNSKNLVTVGAVNDAVTAGLRDLAKATMTTFSSWGPSDDGRVKPDIVANGADLRSTYSTSDSSYSSMSGTSMSSPNAAGSAVLLVDLYSRLFPGRAMRSSTLKALILHTADDVGNVGPDYRFGWGLMNTRAAADLLRAHAANPRSLRMVEAAVTPGQATCEYAFDWDTTSPLRATLCWTDPPGSPHNTLDNRSPNLVHDLDLRLITPGGITNLPYVLNVLTPAAPATRNDNKVDNVEQVDLAAPSESGTYRLQVSVKGALTTSAQVFSLVVSGATTPPEIFHTPLVNTTNTVQPYRIDAQILSEGALSPAGLVLCWASGATNGFTTNVLTATTNGFYTASIPPQPIGTTLRYYLQAQAVNGLTTRLPAAGPAAPFSFCVSEPVSLTVLGTPEDLATCSPPYGMSILASGVVVTASAAAHTDSLGGFRYRNAGWIGTGSAPASGTTNALAFTIREASTLTWRWEPTFRLTQSSTIPGAVNTTNWWPVGSQATTVTAPTTHFVSLTSHRFCGWYIDGQRAPAAGRAANPADGILMTLPRTASAMYLPESTNADADALPDWWEYYFFGSTSAVASADSDGDGFTNQKEYEDGTDPLDYDSIPAPPGIAHVPLPSTVTSPAPWTVSAVVTDNHAVASVTVRWSRNGGPWQTNALALAAGVYSGAIAAPGVTGDTVTYCVEAADAARLKASAGPYTFEVRYPLIDLQPLTLGVTLLPAFSTTNRMLIVSNAGHRALNWTLEIQPGGLTNDVEAGAGGWSHTGRNDAWHIATNRSYSGSSSWHFGSQDVGVPYPDNANAALVSPAVLVPPGGRLSFMHWLATETPKDAVNAWDGGYVEISTNDGATFAEIAPVGGYPYVIYGHSASPFPGGTPCFAGAADWRRAEFDLSAFAFKSVRIGFRFGSDGYVGAAGWHLDDIAVTPRGGQTPWISLSVAQGTTEPGDAVPVSITLTTDSVAPGETLGATLRIRSNDPSAPERTVPVFLHNNSRSISVAQPGHGAITPAGTVYVAAGADASFTVQADSYYHVAAVVRGVVTQALPSAHVSVTNVVWSNVTANTTFSARIDANLTTQGTPEWWLAMFSLTNGSSDAEADADPDGDRLPTWAEFVAGTDPTNAASTFAVADVSPHVTNVLLVPITNEYGLSTARVPIVSGLVLRWASVSNRTYSLWGAPTATSSPVELLGGMAATPPTNAVIRPLTGDGPVRFYRLGVTY
jgi:hypothetical protein